MLATSRICLRGDCILVHRAFHTYDGRKKKALLEKQSFQSRRRYNSKDIFFTHLEAFFQDFPRKPLIFPRTADHEGSPEQLNSWRCSPFTITTASQAQGMSSWMPMHRSESFVLG